MTPGSNVLIVGGAATGWATAHHLLALEPSASVAVVERDPTLRNSSTMLSDGNVRIQFNLGENILMSRYAMECLETFGDDLAVGDDRPDVKLTKQGNLFLVDAPGRSAAEAGLRTQQRLGCSSRWMDMAEIREAFPPMASPSLIGGTFGPDDGSVDPATVVNAYRRRAIADGAVAVADEVASIETEEGRVAGVVMPDGSRRDAGTVVVAAGAWSTDLLATAGVSIPVVPIMRTVYVVSTDVGKGMGLPSAFLPSGVYLIPEHDGTWLMAWSTAADPVGFDFTPAERSRFYDVIWPELVGTLPAFDRLEVTRSWAGLYAQNTLDANAIIGEWPTVSGLYQATGFSGHGYQHCHAVGRHLAETITGREPSLDLTRLGPERVLANEPTHEHASRII